MRKWPQGKRVGHPKGYFLSQKVNPVVKFLTISDIMILTSFGLITPIFAVFITEHIQGGTVEVVGVASSIYLFTKSLGQIPIARFIDKIKGERDDFWCMFIGSLGIVIIPLLYILIKTPLALYIVQFFYGLFAAVVFPAWMAVFTRHIDGEHEGMEWGVYRTMIDFGCAVAASLGGFLAYRFGFAPLFIVISIISLLGSLFLLGVYGDVKGKSVAAKKGK